MTNDDANKKIFANNLKKYLKETGITASELSRRLDIDRSSVTWWTTGRSTPTIERIQQLATIFNCNVSDLISFTPDFFISGKEKELIIEYRKSDDTTKAMIDRLLKYAVIVDESGNIKKG